MKLLVTHVTKVAQSIANFQLCSMEPWEEIKKFIGKYLKIFFFFFPRIWNTALIALAYNQSLYEHHFSFHLWNTTQTAQQEVLVIIYLELRGEASAKTAILFKDIEHTYYQTAPDTIISHLK